MEWSRPTQQGEIPSPRAGHAGVTVGENWFIVGGGDNKSGKCLTLESIEYYYCYLDLDFPCTCLVSVIIPPSGCI